MRSPRSPKKPPIDAPVVFHGGGGSFTGDAALNQVTTHVVRLEGRLLDLETKRMPDLEKEFVEFKGKVVGAVSGIGFVVALISMIGTILALRH